ncbi:MAG TPA: SLBB domain-containing protein, partial [Burkholderiales bacterium]|nr:SLBB domain-containing protein [Burkholderiales bacterium]
MMRRLLAFVATVLLLLAQAGFTPAWAQDMGGSSGSGTGGFGGSPGSSYGGYGGSAGTVTGAAPASAGGASAQGTGTTQAPVVPIPQVQTPSITNGPSPVQTQNLPTGIQQQLQQLQQSLPQAPNQQAPRPQTTQQAQPGTEAGSTRQRNEFQDFIAQSTGQQLPLFGYNLFRGTPSTFAPVENVPVPSDYVIGPGDQLIIRAWGQLDVNYHATVDRNGMIEIPQVGPVEVAGIPYRNLTDVVRTAVSRNFRNFQLLVTMGQLRSIQIYVVGQAQRPGSYTVSSLSTLMNAVFAAGGPSGHGTMRDIELKRGDKVVARLDLYDLLLRGDKSQDAPLLPGDVIYFPPVGPLVALSGSVNTPAIYELKGETTIGELIKMAGGLSVTAQTRRATIERIEHHQARISDMFSLDPKGLERTVQNGDLVSIYSISPKFEDVVTLRGHVASPLRYPYHPGMRIDDLIPSKDALITPDYYLRQNLAVRVQALAQGGLAESVRQLADEINWNYAVIERLNKNDLTTQLIPFNLGKAVLEHDPANNLPLMPGDVVTVFSKTDIQAP